MLSRAQLWLGLYLVRSQTPVLGDEIHQGEGHGKGAEEHVRHGQVGDKHVPRGEHHLPKTTFKITADIWQRIKIEEKAKVVAAVRGTVLIQFLAVLAIWHHNELNRMNSSFSSNLLGAIHPIIQIVHNS